MLYGVFFTLHAEDQKPPFCWHSEDVLAGPHTVEGEDQNVHCAAVSPSLLASLTRLCCSSSVSIGNHHFTLTETRFILFQGKKTQGPTWCFFYPIVFVSHTHINNVWNKIHLIILQTLSQSHVTEATEDFNLNNVMFLLPTLVLLPVPLGCFFLPSADGLQRRSKISHTSVIKAPPWLQHGRKTDSASSEELQ